MNLVSFMYMVVYICVNVCVNNKNEVMNMKGYRKVCREDVRERRKGIV